MKILYVLNRFPVFSETFILNEMIALLQSGHDVSVLSLYRPLPGPVHDRAGRYGLPDRTRYLDWPEPGTRVNFFRSAANAAALFLTDRRLTLTQKFRIARMFLLKSPVQNLLGRALHTIRALPEAIAWIRENRFEHIHSHFAFDGARMAFLAGRILGIPYTLTTHALDLFTHYSKDAGPLLEGAKRVIAISEFNGNFMHNCFGIPREKMDLVHYGIDLDELKPADGYAASPLKIFSAARMVPKKGLEYLIEACRILKERGVRFTCEIRGEGPVRGALEKQITEKGLAEFVKLEKAVKNEEVLRLIGGCSVFVLPCVEAANHDMDGIPYVLMEAMALERPVIATDITGIPELIENGADGVMVSQKDAFGLADAIMRISANAELAEKIRKAGRQKIASAFESRKNAEALVNCFQGQA